MARKRCDACGSSFETRYWYPVAFDETDATVAEFCSVGCKLSFLADE